MSWLAQCLPLNSTAEKSRKLPLSEQLPIDSLPLRAEVITSHLSLQKYSITENTLLDIYSIKSVQVAVIRLSGDQSGKSYLLPLEDSNVKLSPLYNPEENVEKALTGYCYNNIQQVYTANPRPHAVFAAQACLGVDCESSMETDDVYIVKEPVMLLDGKVALICEDVTDDNNGGPTTNRNSSFKAFPVDLSCDLTTDPYRIFLKPSTICPHLKLPAEVLVSCDRSTPKIFLFTEIVSTKCFVASVCSKADQIVEIYDDVPIELKPVKISKFHSNLLTFDAATLDSNHSHSKIINESKYSFDETQLLLLNSGKPIRKSLSMLLFLIYLVDFFFSNNNNNIEPTPIPPVSKRSRCLPRVPQHSIPSRDHLLSRSFKIIDPNHKQQQQDTDEYHSDGEFDAYDYVPTWCKDDGKAILSEFNRRAALLHEGMLIVVSLLVAGFQCLCMICSNVQYLPSD